MKAILEALGGRKFLLTLAILALATVIELKTERGISEQFVALLVGVLGVFSAANATITAKAMNQIKIQEVSDPVGRLEPGAINAPDVSLEQQALEQILINQREHSEVLGQVAKGVSNTSGLLIGMVTKK